MKNLLQPAEFEFAYDNGGTENNGTIDRYTIQLTWENGDSVLIGSNAIASVWSVSEATYIIPEEVERDKEEGYTDIGDQIEWEQIPDQLKNIVNNYIKEIN